MDKAAKLFGGVCAAPIIWMWIQIFFFGETTWLVTFVAYLFLLTSMVNGNLVKKTGKVDKEVQTERNVNEKSTQTEEVTPKAYDCGNGDQPVGTEICLAREELIEEFSESESDSDTPVEPFSEIPFPFKKRIKAVTATCERIKFLAQTDPNLFKDAELWKYVKIADAPFLQRKWRKLKKLFNKK